MTESRNSEVLALVVLAATVLLWFSGYTEGEYSAGEVVVRSLIGVAITYQWRQDRHRDRQLVDGWFITAMMMIGMLD